MINLTKRKRLKNAMLLFFLAFALCQLTAMSKAPLPPTEHDEYIVKDLKAEDLPHDDGTGLLLSWEPLSADARVIEYRIYRGSKKDQLFKIASVTINPKTGFAGERVFYYDNGFNILTTVNSPMKLKKEEQQPEDSPLYKTVPRDLNIIKHKFEDYMVIGITPKKEYYHKSRLVEVKGEEGEDSQYYAGLKDRQFKQIMSRLKAEQAYYYTVIAVNERGKFYPSAPIVQGIPRINTPEKPRRFYSVYLEDKDRMQFEWTMPIITDGIGRVNVYLLAKKDVSRYNRYVEQVEILDENRLLRCDNPDIEPYQVTEKNPAILIDVKGFSQLNYSYIDLESKKIKDKEGNVVFDGVKDKFDDYYTVFSFANYMGMEAFSTPSGIRETNSSLLPTMPIFAVADKPNDKGDANIVYWENPVAFVTNSVFLNEDKTRLTINYEYEKNEHHKIKNIYFDIFDDEGVQIGKRIDKFYQDLFFNIKLPDKYSPKSSHYNAERPISIEIRINLCGETLSDDYIIYQTMKFDEDYVAYMPGDPYLLGNNISKYTYNIYKKPYSGEAFRLVSRSAGIVRQTDDSIKYEDTITQLLSKLQPENQLFLVNTSINAFYDKEAKRPVNTHIFYEVVEKENEKRERELEKLTLEMEEAEDEQQWAQIESKIEGIKKLLAYNDHEFMKEVNSQKNDKLRMKKVIQRREEEMRTFQYKMVKSDGEALFVETDVYTDEEGNNYFFPLPNWFNKERYATLVASFLWGIIVYIMTKRAKQGKDMYIRPIAGIEEIDNAIGRATEMGRPILFNPGLDGIGAVSTLAGLNILGKVAQKAAEYDTRIIVPVRDVITLPIAQEIIKEAHYQAGRPDTYDRNSAFYISGQQFAFVAGVNGVMIREKCATCFYMGTYYAEALIMTEVGNTIGAVQIAGTDAVTQVPFFITTCDYTLIGEELYGASAYLSREPMMMGTLKATDVAKFIILVCMVCGTILSTFKHTFFINMFPDQ